MYGCKAVIVVTGLAALGMWGCGSERSNSEPPSYGELRQEELESERRDFIAQTRRELSDLKTQISRLETRLEHESEFVDADQRAEWRQELFELRQEQDRLQAELSRAENASREDWAQMRGTLGGAVDSLQAGVTKVGLEIADAFGGTGRSGGSEQVACPTELRDADIEVKTVGQTVAVDLTTQQGRVSELRTKVRAIADDYRSMEEGSMQGRAKSESESDVGYDDPSRSVSRDKKNMEAMRELVDKVTIRDIEGGVRVSFTPKSGKAEELQRELKAEATNLDNGDCPAPLRGLRAAKSEDSVSPNADSATPRARASREGTLPR